jgi:hypothetical protein
VVHISSSGGLTVPRSEDVREVVGIALHNGIVYVAVAKMVERSKDGDTGVGFGYVVGIADLTSRAVR